MPKQPGVALIALAFQNKKRPPTEAALLVVFRVHAQHRAVCYICSHDVFPRHFGETLYQHGIGAAAGEA